MASVSTTPGRLSPFYAAGPALSLGTAVLASVHGQAAPARATAFGKARSLRLEGRTDADFGGTTFHTENRPPFFINVDLDCEDTRQSAGPGNAEEGRSAGLE